MSKYTRESFIHLKNKGYTNTEIAETLGCCKSTVTYHLDDEYREKHNNNSNKRKQERLLQFEEITKDDKCIVCGEDEKICLDYHHIFPEDKLFEISRKKGSLSTELILKELEKCICVCSNCHRKIHAELIDLETYL